MKGRPETTAALDGSVDETPTGGAKVLFPMRTLMPTLMTLASICTSSCAEGLARCNAEALMPIEVFVEEARPAYSRMMEGFVSMPEGGRRSELEWFLVRDRGGATVGRVFHKELSARARLPEGAWLHVRVDRVAGFPSATAIVVSDKDGLALAAVSDIAPGATILGDGVPGIDVSLRQASCAPRTKSECYDEITNQLLEVSLGGSTLLLMQGESGLLGGFRVHCLVAQSVSYSPHCADAGLIGVSYLIVRSDLAVGDRG